MHMADELVRMEHINKSYGRVQALDDVTLSVARARSSACSATTAPASRR